MGQADQKRQQTAAPACAPTCAPACAPAAPTAGAGPQLLTLDKGRHRWVFRYVAGDEAAMLSAISDLATDEASGTGAGRPRFDWFDAALVSHQVARRLRSGIDRVENRGSDPRTQNGF